MTGTYLVYNSVLFFVVVFGFCVQRASDKKNELLARTCTFLVMLLPAAIRKGIGTDYEAYVELYRLYAGGTDDHEIGFQMLGQLMNAFHLHYQWFIIILAILCLLPVCYCIPRKYFGEFIVIYFFMTYPAMMSTSRQLVAVSLICCGTVALYHRKGTIRYVACVVCAFLFHYSALILLPFVLLRNIKWTWQRIYCLSGLMIFLFQTVDVINMIFTNELFLESEYGVYAINSYNRDAEIGTGLGVFANVLGPLLFVLSSSKVLRNDRRNGFLLFLSVCFVGGYLLASQIHIFGRLVACFSFVPALLIPLLCRTLTPKYSKLVYMGFFLIYLVLFERTIQISQITLGSGLGISPYRTIFE